MRVLVVEDEHRVAHAICQALIEESFAVDVAHDGHRGWQLASEFQHDAIVLDLMLPGLDGLALCRRIRETQATTPILILSARDMVEDRVRGLDAGADDYLVKPFAIEELLARVRALLRRESRHGSPVFTVGSLRLDPSTRAVSCGNRQIVLTAREYTLLEYFMRRPGIVHTRTMLAEHVWEFPFDHASNVIDVYVKHLRDKIDEGGQPSFIQAVRGVGYVLNDPKTPSSS